MTGTGRCPRADFRRTKAPQYRQYSHRRGERSVRFLIQSTDMFCGFSDRTGSQTTRACEQHSAIYNHLRHGTHDPE